MIYYIATKDFCSTSKSVEIVPFLKLSAQRLHRILMVIYGNLFVERIIIVRAIIIFYLLGKCV